MTKMFDPLEAQTQTTPSDASGSLESQSKAMDNSDPSKCPKCAKGMSLQGISSEESVFFCTGCRVSSPQLVG